MSTAHSTATRSPMLAHWAEQMHRAARNRDTDALRKLHRVVTDHVNTFQGTDRALGHQLVARIAAYRRHCASRSILDRLIPVRRSTRAVRFSWRVGA